MQSDDKLQVIEEKSNLMQEKTLLEIFPIS
jgi:hypothetical protein